MVALLARRLAAAVLVMFAGSMLAASAFAQVTWTGAGDGLSWSDGANWDAGLPPNSTDDVLINLANATVQYDNSACCDISNLTVSGSGAQLEVTTGMRLDVRGNLIFSAGTITGAGDFNVDGNITWTGGDFRGSGSSDFFANVAVNGFGTRRIADRTVNFYGDVNVTNTNQNFDLVVRQESANISIYNSATFSFLTDRTAWLASGSTELYIEGTLQKTGGTGSSVFATAISGSGLLSATSGTLQVGLLGTANAFSGTVTATGATSKVQFQGPATTMTFNGTQFNGSGTIDFNFVESTITSATFNVSGATRIAGVTTIDAASTLTNFGDLTVLRNTSIGANASTNNVSVTNSTLTLTSLLTAGGTGSFSLGTLAGAGGMDVTGALTLSNATIRDGNLLQGNGAVNITGQVQLQGGFLYANSGGTWSAGDVILSNNSSLTLNGAFEITGDNQIRDNGNADRVSNFGTLVKTGGTGTTDIFVDMFNTGGTVQANSGTLNFEAGFKHTGAAALAPGAGATIRLSPPSGFNETFPITTSIAGAGTFAFEGSSAALTLEGTYDVTGGTQITAGTVTFNDDPQLRNLGNVLVDGATTQVTIDSGTNITAGSLTLERGTLTLQRTFFPTSFIFRSGTLEPSGTVLTPDLTWESGTLRGGGINATTTALLSTNGVKTMDDANFDGNATITWTGGNIVLQNGSFISHGGTFNVQTDADMLRGPGEADIFHNGSFVKAANTGVTRIQPDVDVSDTVTIQSGGTLAYEGDLANLSQPNDFLFGRIEGTGTVDLTNLTSLSNAGVVAPGVSPGILNVAGAYDHQSAELEIELGGTTAGTEHDQLAGTGAMTLSGTLDVSLVNGFTPNAGDVFTIVTGSSIAGTFATENLPTLGGGLAMSVVYNASTVQLVVSGGNTPPVANNDAVTVPEGGSATISVLANDDDVDGTLDPASVTVVSPPGFGDATVNANGTITYTNNTIPLGNDSFTYTVNDDDGATSNTATVTITFTTPNLPPGAVSDLAATAQDTPVTIDVLANDFDTDGTLTVESVAVISDASNGTTTNNFDGTVTYTPNTGFTGTDSFVYTVQDDENATSNPATVTITVTAGNAPPVAADDTASTEEDASVTISVLTNDTDADGTLAPGTVAIATTPSSGSATPNADGTITYTPFTSFVGTDVFTYTVEDDDGATSNAATVTVTVTAANLPPVANSDSATTEEGVGVAIAVLANDTDADGTLNAERVVVVTDAINGATVVASNGQVTYTPNTGFTGTDTFQYTVEDDDGAVSNAATVTVTVTAANIPPVANDDAATTPEDTAVTIAVLNDDTDADGTLDPATVVIASPPANGTATPNADGTVTYTPNANTNGTDTFTYTVADNAGATSNSATVTVTVTAVNDAPVATADNSSTVLDIPVTINVLSNDSDVDGTLDITTVAVVTPPTSGAATVNADGTIQYVPNQGFLGTDTFQYTVNDDGGATSNSALVTVTVNPDNAMPVAVDDTATTDEDTAVAIAVLANDTDDGTLNVTTVQIAQDATNGTVEVAEDGIVTYTPNPDFNGTDTFTYTVADTEGARSAAATVTVTIEAVNDAPIAIADAASTDEDTVVQIDVLANDTDIEGDALTVASFTPAALGQVSQGTDGRLIYTPNANTSGTDTFTYSARDAAGATSEPATVTIVISPVNDAPTAQDDAAVTDESTPVLIDVRANDNDVDDALGSLTIALQTAPLGGQVLVDQEAGTVRYTPNSGFTGDDSFRYLLRDPSGGISNIATVSVTVRPVTVGNTPPVAANDEAITGAGETVVINVLANDTDADGTLDAGSLAIVANAANGSTTVGEGTVTYTPNPGFAGTDTFQYTVRDDDGTVSNAATVTVTVNAIVLAPPIANDDTATTDEDTAVQVAVLANDTAEGTIDASQVLIDTAPSLGTAVVDVQGVVTYTPAADVSGTDTFTYTVADTGGQRSNVATVTITITPINDVPVAEDDTAATDEDIAVVIPYAELLANDTDPDGDALTVLDVGEATQGTTALDDGGIRYVPDANTNGTDAFTYTVSDGNDGLATASVTISIAPINDAPVAEDDTATTDEDTVIQVDVLANDTDVDGDVLTITLVEAPSNGTAEVAAQRIVYTPAPNFSGLDTFTYRITDPDGLSSEATVSVAVGNSADAPIALDDAATTDEDTAVQIDVLANDTDPDGDVLRIQSTTTPTLGNAAIAGDGQTLTYTPSADVSGTDTFSYTVSDGNDGFATAVVTVTIRPVNDAPVATDDEAETTAFTPVLIDVLANDTDPEGDLLALVTASDSREGGTTQLVDGQVRYVPPSNFEGIDTFTYRIEDEAGAPDDAQVTVTVGALRYSVVEVGTLGGVSRAMDVNARGEIVGISTDAEGRIQPFFFDGRQIQPVRTPDGQPGHAYAINDEGGIAGFAIVNQTEGYATQGTASGLEALGGLGDGRFSTAHDINNAGSVVGTAQADDQYRAVMWGTPDPIGPDALGTEAFGVNDSDVAVGVASLGDGQTQAFAGETLLPSDGNSRAYAVNNAGSVVGSSEADGTFTAVAWLDGEPVDVAEGGEAYAINDAGWIVGTHTPTAQASKNTFTLPSALLTITERRRMTASKSGTKVGSSGFISIEGTLRDLTASIDPATGWQITEARGINATGEIAAVGVRDGVVEALLLRPTSNLAPSAQQDRATLAAGETLLLDVLANDADPDGDALTLIAVNAADHGQVMPFGDTQIRYTPPAGFYGLDTFTYVVSDGRGGTAVADVAITVEPPLDFTGEVELAPAYPNPFNPTTALTIRAKTDSEVQLAVYDALGRYVRTVFAGPVSRGQHTYTFNADGLASGLYLVRLVARGGAQTQRLMLLK